MFSIFFHIKIICLTAATVALFWRYSALFFIVKENEIGNVNGNKFSRNVNGIKPKKNWKKEIGERGAHADPFHSSNQSSPSTSCVVLPTVQKKSDWGGHPAAAGRPTAGRPGGRPPRWRPAPRDLRANIFAKVFAQKPLPPRSGATRCLPPGSGAAGVYSCKFRKRKYIFL